MKTLLKDMKLCSVDLVPQGANPDAYICLYKSADMTFNGIIHHEEERRLLFSATGALQESIIRITESNDHTQKEKRTIALQSIKEFLTTLTDILNRMFGDNNQKGDQNIMNIDKTKLSSEESATLDALLAKCGVEEPAPEPPANEPEPAPTPQQEPTVEKSEELTKALSEVAELRKQLELSELRQVAKKYALLGKEEDKLTDTLYEMKKSGDSIYAAYVAELDSSLALCEKSGLFDEVGKSTHGSTGSGGVIKKIHDIAKEYCQKYDLTFAAACAKAWEDNPQLVTEYEKGDE